MLLYRKMKKQIVLVDIKDTSSADWKILRFETCGTTLAEKLRMRSAGLVIASTKVSAWVIGEVHDGYTIVSENSDVPYYEGQEPFGDDALFYQSFVVDVVTNARL